MVDASLVAIMACPETHQPLKVADETLVAKINAAIGAGALKNRDGVTLSDPIQTGLVREDGAYLYPVRNDLPQMLVGEAIELANLT